MTRLRRVWQNPRLGRPSKSVTGLTGVRALEALVQLEGEGNVDLHHLHLRYSRRVCYYASAAAKHQVVAVDAEHHHVPGQIKAVFRFKSVAWKRRNSIGEATIATRIVSKVRLERSRAS